MPARFHHVGIVVKDIEAALAKYGAAFGVDGSKVKVEVGRYETAHDAEEFKYAFFPLGNDNYIEFVQPITPGPTATLLDKRGEGMFHLAFATDEVASAKDVIEGAGIPLVGSNPDESGEQSSVFYHPKHAHGVLLQVVKEGVFGGRRPLTPYLASDRMSPSMQGGYRHERP
jgi:methylmalonyl-CoA/ethylmalonyl-CoA epimerase